MFMLSSVLINKDNFFSVSMYINSVLIELSANNRHEKQVRAMQLNNTSLSLPFVSTNRNQSPKKKKNQ